MQVKYGTYGFPANGVKVAFSQQTQINAGGQPYEVTKRLDLDGYLEGDGQAALVQAASALATALAVPYQDLVLYTDAGSPTDCKLLNASSTTGVVVTDLQFPDSIGGEYATFRRFTMSAEASYPVTDSMSLLVSFSERLSFSGGGPIYRHRMAVNGRPQKQLVYPFSIFKVTQEGQAVGFRKRPTPPGPIWPNALMEAPDRTIDAPQRRGKGYTDFAVSWRYNFESAVELVGVPNIWKG